MLYISVNRKNTLPSKFRKKSLRIFPNPPLPELVGEKEKQAESNGEEKVLDGDLARVNGACQTRDIQENENHHQSEQDSWEKSQILRRFVEHRWLLKD
jgi:hypothetical protein